jgi:DNA-binding CsgD family transcriptional regulator
MRGFAAGGVDYVKKPVIVDELLARVRVHLANAHVTRGSQAALDAGGRSVLAVNASGEMLWSTPLAGAIIDRHFAAPAAWQALAQQLRTCAIDDNRSLCLQPVEGGRVEFGLLETNSPGEWLFRIAEFPAGAEERLLAERYRLTDREAEVLLWISHGKSNREISEILGISPRTVNKHLEQVFEKMGIENRASAAAAAVKTLAG